VLLGHASLASTARYTQVATKTMIVVLARKLVIALWRLVTMAVTRPGTWPLSRPEEWARRLGASPPMRMTYMRLRESSVFS
jgi:hypothetical protein